MNEKHLVMKFIKFLGKVLVIISLLFVVYRLYKMDFEWDYFSNPYRVIGIIFLLSFLALLNNFINAYVWKKYIDYFSGIKHDISRIISIYLKANIEKYLPGNIVQYAGRNLLGKNEGIDQKSLAISSIMELVGISIAAVIFSFVVSLENTLSVIKQLWSNVEIRRTIIVLICLAVIILVACLIVCVRTRYLKAIRSYLKRELICLSIFAFLLYCINYIISGVLSSLIFILILHCNVDYFQIASTNVLAWLAGYVVPGSPGGIGIREAVLILLLGTEYSMETVTMSAVILRICGVIGDFLSYIMAVCLDFYNKRKI